MYDSPDRTVGNTADGSLVGLAHGDQQAQLVETPMSGVNVGQLPNSRAASCCIANPDEKIGQLTNIAAKLLAADGCMILLLDGVARNRMTFKVYSSGRPVSAKARQEWTQQGETVAREAIKAGKALLVDKRAVVSDAGRPIPSARSAASIMASPIRVGSHIVGAINLVSLGGVQGLGSDRLAAVEIVAWLVGQALHVVHLENLLNSRFAQFAVAEEAGHALGNALALGSGRPDQLVRILAKSFYREMIKMGFDSGQIIGGASEIISQLSGSLKKHSDRWHRTGKNRHEPS